LVLPGFRLTPDNALAVAEICQRLDGIPLALELAAARVKVLRVEQIAARLTDSFRLLTGGSRTALPRQQTLQAAIDWSYDLLSEAEQQLFNRLAVFAGGWTLEAAEAVCAGEGLEARDVLDLLMQLVNKSLVLAERAPEADTRYRLLETVRQYALARLAASGEADSVRRRHAEYYVALAERDGPRATNIVSPAWLDRMELELGNLRAALAWSLSGTGLGELGLGLTGMLSHFWIWRGYWDEFRRWLEAALALSDAAGAPLTLARARALLSLADVGGAFGQDFATLQGWMAESLALFEALGERSLAAWVLHQMGWRAREHGDTDTARARLEESVAIYRELGDQPGLKGALISLGGVLVMAEDTVSALPVIEEGLALARQAEDALMTGWALNHLGHVAHLEGAYERARRLHEESLVPFDKIGPRHEGTIWAHQGLGETALARGDGALATAHFTKALALCQELSDRTGTAWCLAGLAGVAALAEEPERAAWLWGAAEALRLSQEAREAPAARATHERLKASVRDQLGEAAFDAAWAAGRAAPMEQAISRALAPAA
jgi:non-specific serine/threonine protein kinase